jgi:hypothetical protein
MTSTSCTIICTSFKEGLGFRLQSCTRSDLSCVKSDTVGEKICGSSVEQQSTLRRRWRNDGAKDHPCVSSVTKMQAVVVFIMVRDLVVMLPMEADVLQK